MIIMRLLFKLSGEHSSLPKAELLSVLEGEGIDYRVSAEYPIDRLILLDADADSTSFVERLALTQAAACDIVRSQDLDSMAREISGRLSRARSFSVRCQSKNIERELGRRLVDLNSKLRVDLESPEVEIVCYGVGNDLLVGVNIPLNKDFSRRRPQHRPFFHPTSMEPKLARVLVNLARVKKGDSILDPFCGTGGILIEAGLVGLKVYGWDISRQMVEGCRRNLGHYGIAGRVQVKDALNPETEARFDAIVSDPPYGRSSYTTEEIGTLYNRFTEVAHGLLMEDARMVLVSPHTIELDYSSLFELESEYSVRVHKSLTRRIRVLVGV